MTNRESTEEQNTHDEFLEWLARESGRYATDDEYRVFTNPGSERNKMACEVDDDPRYPDIVRVRIATGTVATIAEVETEESVNESEAEQWERYAECDTYFYLYVPAGSEEEADTLIDERSIEIKGLRTYTWDGEEGQISNIWTRE